MTAGNATRENERAPLVIGAIAALLAAVGLVFVVSMTVGAEPAVDVRTEAREGDLSVWVEQFEWIAHDHGAAEGDDVDPQVAAIQDVTAQAQVFPMPSNMMTGTPDVGFARMPIELNVLNRGAGVAAVVPTIEVDEPALRTSVDDNIDKRPAPWSGSPATWRSRFPCRSMS